MEGNLYNSFNRDQNHPDRKRNKNKQEKNYRLMPLTHMPKLPIEHTEPNHTSKSPYSDTMMVQHRQIHTHDPTLQQKEEQKAGACC